MGNTNEIIQEIKNYDDIILLLYEGILSQPLIASMIESLENKIKEEKISLNQATNIFIVFIEMSQNIMNYSNKKNIKNKKGFVLIAKDKEYKYCVVSRNIIEKKDKEILSKRLKEITNLDKNKIRLLYREHRKNGKYSHKNGAGIGFLEIAKHSDKIEYEFININNDISYFIFKSYIK